MSPPPLCETAILKFLEDGSEPTREKLMQKTGFSRDMIKKTTLRLMSEGKVECVRTGHVYRYRMTKRFLGDKCLLASCWTRAGEAAQADA